MNKDTFVRGLGALVLAGSLALGAGSAVAGEITGNGKSLQIAPHTLHGNSACAFSGLQDSPPEEALATGHKGIVAQSWGQLVRPLRDFLTSIGLHPGTACNPTKATGEP